MDDDATIRGELRQLADRRLRTPGGHLSVSLSDVAASGIETDEAVRWVEANGGYVDRTEHRRRGLGPTYGHVDAFVRLVVPENSLRG